ncbi:MAG: hypothetical protein KGO92_13465 [Bacteroidota bacterium]|nr:hypothetical protein [Bacteroidota bacterium]
MGFIKHFPLFLLFSFLVIMGCQDKYLMEPNLPSAGTLKADNGQNCLPQKVNGNWIAGKALNDTNTLEVSINVTRTGNYQVQTNLVDGIQFSGSGRFGAKGVQVVTLKATGTPVQAGTVSFVVQYDSSQCSVAVTVLPPGGLTVPAEYSLAGSPNSCFHSVLFGSYIQGLPLNNSDSMTLQVTVTNPGTYTLQTNTVNGYHFTGSGQFTKTGIQKVTLKGSGTPLLTGQDSFTVSGSNTDCTIPVTVLTAVSTSNPDHFPLTYPSYWNYDDLLNTGDTLQWKVTDSTRFNGNLYKVINQQGKFGNPVPAYYRKTDSVYYENTDVGKYTVSFNFLPVIVADVPILREYLKTGDSWTSNEFIGPAAFGQTIFYRLDFTCLDADATVTVNGKNFIHVYKILLMPKIKSALTYPYNSTSEKLEYWYAKGVGLIYSKTINNNFTIYEKQIRNWQVF